MAYKVKQIKIASVNSDIDTAFIDRTSIHCDFCGKSTAMSHYSKTICEKLSKKHKMYCKFCLRNDLTSKSNRHVLILTFRSLFGYFYHIEYKGKKNNLYMAQLNDIISAHAEAGLTNPIFKYDPESMLWFIDFNKVGSTGRKIPIQNILETIINILVCFNLSESIPNFKMHKLYEKYEEAIKVFYTNRTRPEGKPILCPTVQGCGPFETKDFPFEKTRDFTLQDKK